MGARLFLKIPIQEEPKFIKGEAEDWSEGEKHKDHIVCETWSFDAGLEGKDLDDDDDEDTEIGPDGKPKQKTSAKQKNKKQSKKQSKKKKEKKRGRMADDAGKTLKIDALDFTKQPDISTTVLLSALDNSTIYDSAEFTLIEELQGSGAEPFKLVVNLKDVRVVEYKLTAQSGDKEVEMSESWKLRFSQIHFVFGSGTNRQAQAIGEAFVYRRESGQSKVSGGAAGSGSAGAAKGAGALGSTGVGGAVASAGGRHGEDLIGPLGSFS